MKTLLRTFAALIALSTCSAGSNAKVFDFQHLPKNINQLQNADSFSVECRNDRTGVIDRESVDVDAATVTVEIPGSGPIVHHITQFVVTGHKVQDRFGQPGLELYLAVADWGRIGASGVGLLLSGNRWLSHHEDDTWWTCAN
jgi:hypothetical protein